jgi:hypothetical protein
MAHRSRMPSICLSHHHYSHHIIVMAEASLGFALYLTVTEDSLDFPSILYMA